MLPFLICDTGNHESNFRFTEKTSYINSRRFQAMQVSIAKIQMTEEFVAYDSTQLYVASNL